MYAVVTLHLVPILDNRHRFTSPPEKGGRFHA